jgi:hypothetical protein
MARHYLVLGINCDAYFFLAAFFLGAAFAFPLAAVFGLQAIASPLVRGYLMPALYYKEIKLSSLSDYNSDRNFHCDNSW